MRFKFTVQLTCFILILLTIGLNDQVVAQNIPIYDSCSVKEVENSLQLMSSFSREPRVMNMEEVSAAIDMQISEEEMYLTDGKVYYRVEVSETGEVLRACCIKGHRSFLRERIDPHLEKLRFEPASNADGPVAAWVIVPFRYCFK